MFVKNISPKINYDLYTVLRDDSKSLLNFLYGNDESLVILDEKYNELDAKGFLREKMLLRMIDRDAKINLAETGKSDLYLAFLFLCGKTANGTLLKSPMFLYPIKISISNDEIFLEKTTDCPIINTTLFTLLSKEYGVNIPKKFINENIEISPKNISEIIEVLRKLGMIIRNSIPEKIQKFSSQNSSILTVKKYLIIGRYSADNPIYKDYCEMEELNLSTPEIDLLLQDKPIKKRKNRNADLFHLNELDYSQEMALRYSAEKSNLVIYGPPGTGKSQTIVSIIGNALCQNKKILVVCQKYVALEVIFSRMGALNSKAMILSDIIKDKNKFYNKVKTSHSLRKKIDTKALLDEYEETNDAIKNELSILNNIDNALHSPTSFGITLREMYDRSYIVGKDSGDYELYDGLTKTNLIKMNYPELESSIRYILDKNLIEVYLEYKSISKDRFFIDNLKLNIDVNTIKECICVLEKIEKNPFLFDYKRNEYFQYLLPYIAKDLSHHQIDSISNTIMSVSDTDLFYAKKLSYIPFFWITIPFIHYIYSQKKKEIVNRLNDTKNIINKLLTELSPLKTIFDEEGYSIFIENIILNNTTFIKNLKRTLNNYSAIHELKCRIKDLSKEILEILDFCYENSSKNYESFYNIIKKIIPLRTYHEITFLEEKYLTVLQYISDFENIKNRISNLHAKRTKICNKLALAQYNGKYDEYCQYDIRNKEYLYQMNKEDNRWSIKQFFNYFYDYLIELFPCWLLSPENVSDLFPLKKNLFDIVIFDEASQLLIENAIPSIYRSNKVVVVGDNKQLQPSTAFSKKFALEDYSPLDDLSIQSALEAKSLFDLAKDKFSSIYLEYHYRSQHSELIDFSNTAFYSNRLKIAPNNELYHENPPIERIKVNGMWKNRQNVEEAKMVIATLRDIISRKNETEDIGIITFNVEQMDLIIDYLDAEVAKPNPISKKISLERNKIINGENHSLFVKNIENIQGDERDYVIFSSGYAKSEDGKLRFRFGSLSNENGENRLNVAITRARKKIFFITSIEPEELNNVLTCKSNGPKLLRDYLSFSRAVSENDVEKKKYVLSTLPHLLREDSTKNVKESLCIRLKEIGYNVVTDLGTTEFNIPIAIMDDKKSKYLLGIMFDEKENFGQKYLSEINFLESKGWNVLKIWTREWWLSPTRVLDKIDTKLRELTKINTEVS